MALFRKNPIVLLGIAGGAGVGKDTIADIYLRQYGFVPMALADEIKARVIASGQATFEEVFITKPSHIRTLLQEEGTERGRNVYGESYWFNCLMARAQITASRTRATATRIVVPDVRFPNEVQLIQQAGGRVIKLEAPERYAANGMTAAARLHASERALDGFTAYDAVIQNDPDDAGTVGGAVETALVQMGLIGRTAAVPGAVRFGV